MSARTKSPDHEIWCDFNGRITERGYRPTRGAIEDLAALGLTLDDALGRRFVFVSEDEDEHGNRDDIMHGGTVVRDPRWGILLETDNTGFYRRSELND